MASTWEKGRRQAQRSQGPLPYGSVALGAEREGGPVRRRRCLQGHGTGMGMGMGVGVDMGIEDEGHNAKHPYPTTLAKTFVNTHHGGK